MRRIMLNLLDREQARHRGVPLPLAEALIAALSAEPDTLGELAAAARRFVRSLVSGPLGHRDWLQSWAGGTCVEPADAGVALIDLAGRTIIWRTDGHPPGPQGYVDFEPRAEHDRDSIRIWFQLSNQWQFFYDFAPWKSLLAQRRQARRERPQLDARSVLYDGLIEFLVSAAPTAAVQYPQPCSRQRGTTVATLTGQPTAAQIRLIHTAWLTTPRADLAGQSPREILLAQREWIDFDLQSRRDQWSLTGNCPPGIARTTAAYRQAGFGTHENVMYYELVRHLLQAEWDQLIEQRDPARVVRQLEQQRDHWLQTTRPALTGAFSPRFVIDQERCRIPLAVRSDETVLECECPLCQLMAEEGPTFIHFDQSQMDDDFVFSLCATHEQWEAARNDWRDWNSDQPLSDASSRPIVPAESTPETQLIDIAAGLTELGVDLKQQECTCERAQSLNRHFRRLREVLKDSSAALLEPAVEQLCGELLDVGHTSPELAEKCGQLHHQLSRFISR